MGISMSRHSERNRVKRRISRDSLVAQFTPSAVEALLQDDAFRFLSFNSVFILSIIFLSGKAFNKKTGRVTLL
jgi:hypothetical protein